MSDCDSNEGAMVPASWRCRGSRHSGVPNMAYRDRRLCSNFDLVSRPSPPSYTVTMQQQCNYIWNPSVGGMDCPDNVRMVESSSSHVHSLSLIQVTGTVDGNEESRLDDVEEENGGVEESVEGKREGGEKSSSLPPLYVTKTDKEIASDNH